ncbi:PAS domain S-box protein [Marinimicrobium agarilyticum]|uniref:PAS domain S-box protein n=1 Tax=Marinimicrobium agarilyticum TaxID=306546 RepID=UPI00146DE359|nr:PAS domain S-box protein [Marinimicrobium agarilyticum]
MIKHSAERGALPDAVLLVVDQGEQAVAACHCLSEAALLERLPLVVIGPDDNAARLAALDAGAWDYLSPPRDGVEARLQRWLQPKIGASTGAGKAEDVERLSRLIEAQARIVSTKLDLESLMQLVVDEVQTLTGADGAVVELAEGDEMVYRSANGDAAGSIGVRLKIQSSLSGLCVRLGEVLKCDDSELDPRVDRAASRRVGLRSMVCTPLRHSGEVVGVLKIIGRQPHAFDALDLKSLTIMGDIVASALYHEAVLEERRALLSDKEAALSQLNRSNERLRSLISSAPIAMCARDEAGRIILWNAAAERLLGYEAADVEGLSETFMPPEDEPAFKQLIESQQVGLPTEPLRTRMKKQDGATVDVSITAAPFPELDGQSGSINLILDIGEQLRLDMERKQLRSRLEQQVADRTASLEETTQKLETIFEQTGVGLALVGTDGRWLQVNQRLCDIVGYPKEELLELTFQNITHEDDLEIDLAQATKLFAGEITSYSMDKRYIRKDGSVVWISLTGSLHRDSNGQIIEAIAAIQDISERKRAQDAEHLFHRALLPPLTA